MRQRLSAIISSVFREREFMHYDEEKGMRVVKLTVRSQIIASAVFAAMIGYTGVATGAAVMAAPDGHLEQQLADSRLEAKKMRTHVAALRNDIDMQAARLAKRQNFLASLYEGKADLGELAMILPKEGSNDVSSPSLMQAFTRLEETQLAFVDEASTAAEARYRDHQATLRSLGLRPERFVRQSVLGGVGGPDIGATADGSPLNDADPHFAQLFLSWKKLDLLEKGLNAVPSYKPVKSYTYTSGYGVRFDPFKGTTAMHQGVDMSGPVGEPIYAAAEGTIVRSGRHGGYGKLVEIDHGSGLTTRYAHMSRLDVRVGDRVARGEKIGGMGSTGRSTGSHLHYEVRIDGRAVNPMPFLETADIGAMPSSIVGAK
ncbi:peptidoglycan DD-metalloendopeptidase family protein [Pacificimonas sp. WHA3]|uniref:Peptidoglycan DD-metalloendopeptidase family protein n=1 Tax=Pacificimonas pallii TaxID=2827236 RepID=A0ABS6SH23_9SPHN|nr:M23 family metallopeptidase [Pacificimonas pallii]MBV7257646.1 peptidoglycan DD-metalloendopeptidase family protein [Pacificimonas pallii]